MFCAQCGTPIKDGAKFCGNCGWAVPAETAPPAAVQIQVPPTAAQAAPVQAAYQPPPAVQPVPPQYTGQTPYPAQAQYQAPPQYQMPPQHQRAAVDYSADKGITALKILSITPLPLFVLGVLVFSFLQFLGNQAPFAVTSAFFIFSCLFAQSLLALIKGVKYKKTAIIIVSIIALLVCIVINTSHIIVSYDSWCIFNMYSFWLSADDSALKLIGLFLLLYPFVTPIAALLSFRKRNTRQTYYGN